MHVEPKAAAGAASEGDETAADAVQRLNLDCLPRQVDVTAARRVLGGRRLRTVSGGVQGEGSSQRGVTTSS